MPELSALDAVIKVGNVADGNYTEFETTGFIRKAGTAIHWRDVYPSYILPISGAAAPDSVAKNIAGIPVQLYAFDGNATEERLSAKFEIDHDMLVTLATLQALDIAPEFHVHWCPTDTDLGVVKWFVDWVHMPANGLPEAQIALSATTEITDPSPFVNRITSIGEFPSDFEFDIGDVIIAVLRRDPTDDDDTYAHDVALLQFALHVPCDTAGSRQIYTK